MRKPTDSWLHTSDLNDGSGSSENTMKSVTEESSLNEFLRTAQIAGTDFTAERLNLRVVTETHNSGLPTAEEAHAIATAQEENRAFLRIPRRPAWDENTTPEQLDDRERDSFLKWRRELAKLQEKELLILTPFEKNLDFWRQLWRVIERSDIIVQIVDARNPLLFHCPDLEKYVKEVDTKKENLLLINKSDLLTDTQRAIWFKYFHDCGVRVVFWSATEEQKRLNPLKSVSVGETNSSEDSSVQSDSEESLSDADNDDELLHKERLSDEKERSPKNCYTEIDREMDCTTVASQSEDVSSGCAGVTNSDEFGALSDTKESQLTDSDVMEGSKLLTCDQLLDIFRSLGKLDVEAKGIERGDRVITAGLVRKY
jgi:large subunit GTPase 1